MNDHADYMRDLEQVCAEALDAAATRPLTDDEITALRFAAAIPKGAPRPATVANKEASTWH